MFGDRYLLEDYLGRDTLGTTWVALDLRAMGDPAQVALKVLTACAPIAADREAAFRSRLAMTRALVMPQVARVLDCGVAVRTPYIAVELLEGETLERHLMRVRRISLGQCLWLLRELAEVMTEAHSEGFIHGELRTSNLFLAATCGTSRPQLKVLDFGVQTRTLLDPGAMDVLVSQGSRDQSPEQTAHGVADARSDVWAIGAILYRCLTGLRPFQPVRQGTGRGSGGGWVPPSSIVGGLAPSVDWFFERALHREPFRRHHSVGAMLEAFEHAMTGDRWQDQSVEREGPEAEAPTIVSALPVDDEPLSTSTCGRVRSLRTLALKCRRPKRSRSVHGGSRRIRTSRTISTIAKGSKVVLVAVSVLVLVLAILRLTHRI
ncbi:MAG: serine/threonine protein kinase [Polyangiaceae bacterium]|nr:serine/threonine protein kinase [Polyangiaceae bacterium]